MFLTDHPDLMLAVQEHVRAKAVEKDAKAVAERIKAWNLLHVPATGQWAADPVSRRGWRPRPERRYPYSSLTREAFERRYPKLAPSCVVLKEHVQTWAPAAAISALLAQPGLHVPDELRMDEPPDRLVPGAPGLPRLMDRYQKAVAVVTAAKGKAEYWRSRLIEEAAAAGISEPGKHKFDDGFAIKLSHLAFEPERARELFPDEAAAVTTTKERVTPAGYVFVPVIEDDPEDCDFEALSSLSKAERRRFLG